MSTNAARIESGAGRAGGLGNVALWVLQVGAAAMLFMAGWMKLTGAPDMVALFDAIGVGQWFRYVTGGIEVGGAALLLVPRLAGMGALLLAATMVGAIITHVAVIGGSFAVPLVLLVVTATIAWARRERTLRLLGR
jgi:uncharacterized membrane protein YphA (DoxX/SURF4 family)